MQPEILLLNHSNSLLLSRVAPEVFDNPLRPDLIATFLSDPRHHIVVAIADDLVVGFVSAVHYINPDKPPELWINEVGVAPSHHRQGIGRAMLQRMLEHGAQLGCVQAWVLTDIDNEPARGLYRAAGGVEAAKPAIMVEFSLPLEERPGSRSP